MEIRKYGHVITVTVIGVDDQGRTLVRCPARGCGESAYIDDDGRVICPTAESIAEFLSHAITIMEARQWP